MYIPLTDDKHQKVRDQWRIQNKMAEGCSLVGTSKRFKTIGEEYRQKIMDERSAKNTKKATVT